MIEVFLPKFGLTMSEGTIVEWYVEEGDTVAEGERLFSVETEKVETEVPAPASGVLSTIVAPAESVVPVGDVVGWIEERR